MDISVSYYSSTGARKNNEDAVSIQECRNGLLALVADGLGGHDKGEVASNLAISVINRELLNKTADEDNLLDAIEVASKSIFQAREKSQQMSTTIAALWVGDYTALTANVGDTRIYHFRDGKILYQSLDHSVAQMAVLVGEMRAEQIRTSPDRNKLIRVLGNEAPPKIDCECLNLRKGDRLLMCSDGFWEAVEESQMLRTMENSATAKQWLEEMKYLVTLKGKPEQDNHTAVALIINA